MGSISENEQVVSGIPIVDFGNWNGSSTPAKRAEIASSLVDACRRVGFVYIINHGVSPTLLEEAFEWSKRLFDMKQEEKMLAPHPDGHKVHRGYSWPGLEKVSQVISTDLEVGQKLREVTDCKESYEIGSEENKEQPNVWLPDAVLPGFRSFMTGFYWECAKTSAEILKAIGKGIGLEDEEFLLKFHSGYNNQVRLLHYPPIAASLLENGKMARIPAHSDWGSITMLFQDDCGGLEVESPGQPGEFIQAHPLKNALVMNVGDLLMRWTNDDLKSTLHRVTLPPFEDRFTGEERITRARYSIPYFVSPDVDASIECLPCCSSSENPVKYEPVIEREYRLKRALLQY